MKAFFLNENLGIPFHLFGSIHFGCLAVLILSMVMIHHFHRQIKNISDDVKKKIRIIMFLILIGNMLLYYGSYLYYGVYDIRVHLPLHFCFIAGNLFMIYLLTRNKTLYHVTFFLTFIGPLPAVIYPDITTGFDSFIFYQYFISHHLLMIFSYFILYMDDHKMDIKDVFRTFVFANMIFISMMIFNTIFGTNYIMSKRLPAHIYGLFPILQKINPIPILELVGITVVMILYVFVYIKNKEDEYGI